MKELIKTDPAFQIRNLTTDDLDQYNALLRYAFQVTEEDLRNAGWRDDEIKQSKFPILERADILGCYYKETLVSQFAVYPLQMNIYGEICPIGFVTSVSTYPEFSGKGIMATLMRQSLTRMREKKQPVALLYPYSIPLYRKFGWEIISNKISFTVKDYQIPGTAKAEGYVRRVDWDSPDFMELHGQFARKTHGCLLRNVLAWEEYWRWDEDDTTVAVYYSSEGKAYGYMVYLIKGDIMYIKEMIYLNREAQKGLWEYIHAHNSMIDEVRGNTYFSEPIAFDMEDGDIKETIRPYIMGRIVDVEQFLQNYRCNPDTPEVLITFDISDPILEWNQRIFTICFDRGQCSLVEKESPFRVRMTIGTLSALMLGYKTAAQLAWREKIEGDAASIRMLDSALQHELPYISDYI